MHRFLIITFACLVSVASLHASSVIVSNDEWLFTDTFFTAAGNDGQAFAANLALLLTAGNAGPNCKVKTIQIVEGGAFNTRFGPAFVKFLKGLGYNVPAPIYPAPAVYSPTWDAVLTVGNVALNAGSAAANDAALTTYVNAGGSVFVEGGTGDFKGSPSLEAAAWNPFLSNFGLAFKTTFNGILATNVNVINFRTQGPYGIELFGPTTTNGAVSSLYIDQGQDVLPAGSNPNTQIFTAPVNGAMHGLYGAWRQPWIALKSQPGVNVGPMLQLRDGRILVHEEQAGNAANWWILTPDACGSYVNGTWSFGGSMQVGYAPFYFSSQVFLDGKNVLVEGGEYNNGQADWTTLGALGTVTPFTGGVSWVSNSPPTGWSTIGDAGSVILPNGQYLQANCCTKQTAYYNGPNSWTVGPSVLAVRNGEAGYTLLPNDDVLMVDVQQNTNCGGSAMSTEYLHNGQWHCGPQTTVQLWQQNDQTLGAAVLTYPTNANSQGTVFQMGGNVNASNVLDVASNTWFAGPTPPNNLDQADGPAALEPNGSVLAMLSPGLFSSGCQMLEYNSVAPTAMPLAPNPQNCPADSSFQGHLMILPTGQIMFTDLSDRVEVYTPTPGSVPVAGPIITAVSPVKLFSPSSNNILTGTQFNGLTQNNGYGDDYQGDTNYPLLRFTSLVSGRVYYALTHDDSSHSIAPNTFMTTMFDIPPGIPSGSYSLVVVANGIASQAVSVMF